MCWVTTDPIDPEAVVNVTGEVSYSVAEILNCVLLTTSNTKYLVVVVTPPNTVPVNIMLSPAYRPVVLSQVILSVPVVVAVHVGATDNGAEDARSVD